MTQDRTENSRAPPMRHHGYKMARRVSDTYKMCDCFILFCSKNVLIYRNIHSSKLYPGILKLQQKFTLFWIFPRILITERTCITELLLFTGSHPECHTEINY